MEETLTIDVKILVLLIALGIVMLAAFGATVLNIRNTKGPKERGFVLRACAGTWGMFLSFLVLVYLLGPPARYLVVVVYVLAFPVLIYRWSTTHQLIRHLEERDDQDDAGPAQEPKRAS